MSDPFAPAPDLLETSPPLSIRHLLLWIASSTVLLTANLAMNRILEERLEVSLTEQTFFGSVRAITDGPAVAGLLVWLARKRRGVRFPVQPGEWLLVLDGISALLMLLTMTAWCQLPQEHANQILLLPAGLMAGGYLIAALWPPLPKWWRFALLANSSLWGVELAQHFLISNFFQIIPDSLYDLIGPLYFLASMASVIVLIVCIIIDQRRHIQRGWLHWTGVATCMASLLLAISQHAYYHWIRG